MTAPKRDLIEPEGVNAGSADSATEGAPPRGDVRSGGHAERAEDQDEDTEADEIVDAPFQPRDPDAPSLELSIEEGAHGGT